MPLSLSRFVRTGSLTVAVACGPAIDAANALFAPEGVGSTAVSQVLRGILAVLMLLSLRRISTVVRGGWFVLPLIFLAGYGALQAAVYAVESLVFSVRIAFLVLVWLSALECSEAGDVNSRWAAVVAWAIILSVMTSQALGRVLGVGSVYGGGFAFAGVTAQPALIAASATAALPLFLWRARREASTAVAVVLVMLCVAATQRRSALVSVALAIVAHALWRLRKSRRAGGGVPAIVGVVAVFIVVIAIVGATPLGGELAERFAEARLSSGGTGSGRVEFQAIVVEHILDRGFLATFFGEGPEKIRTVIGRSFGMAIGAHNDWLDIACACGLVGLALFAWFHVSLVRCLTRVSPDDQSVVVAALVALVTLEVTAGGALDPSVAPIFALLGAMCGATRRGVGALRPAPSPAWRARAGRRQMRCVVK